MHANVGYLQSGLLPPLSILQPSKFEIFCLTVFILLATPFIPLTMECSMVFKKKQYLVEAWEKKKVACLTIKEDDLMETDEEGVGELSCESSFKIDSTDFVLEKEDLIVNVTAEDIKKTHS